MSMKTDGYKSKKISYVLQTGFLVFTLLMMFLIFVLLTIATPAQNLSSAEQDYKRGLAKYNKGDFDGAIANFDKVIENYLTKASMVGGYQYVSTTAEDSINVTLSYDNNTIV